MLYKIGTSKELDTAERSFPECVMAELAIDLALLDCAYGNRKIYEEGGYAVVAETGEDLTELMKIVDYNRHPCEWVTRLGMDSGWSAALFLLTNDFAIKVFMPVCVLPDVLMKDLED